MLWLSHFKLKGERCCRVSRYPCILTIILSSIGNALNCSSQMPWLCIFLGCCKFRVPNWKNGTWDAAEVPDNLTLWQLTSIEKLKKPVCSKTLKPSHVVAKCPDCAFLLVITIRCCKFKVRAKECHLHTHVDTNTEKVQIRWACTTLSSHGGQLNNNTFVS